MWRSDYFASGRIKSPSEVSIFSFSQTSSLTLIPFLYHIIITSNIFFIKKELSILARTIYDKTF